MVKQSKAILQLLRTNCLSVFGYFVRLAFKGLCLLISRGIFRILSNIYYVFFFFFFFLQNFSKFEQTGHIIIEMFRQIYLKISTLITLKVDDKIWNGFLEGFYNRNVFHDKDSCFQLINLSKLFFRSFWDDFVNLA